MPVAAVHIPRMGQIAVWIVYCGIFTLKSCFEGKGGMSCQVPSFDFNTNGGMVDVN